MFRGQIRTRTYSKFGSATPELGIFLYMVLFDSSLLLQGLLAMALLLYLLIDM